MRRRVKERCPLICLLLPLLSAWLEISGIRLFIARPTIEKMLPKHPAEVRRGKAGVTAGKPFHHPSLIMFSLEVRVHVLFQHFDGINSMSHEIALPSPPVFLKMQLPKIFNQKLVAY